MKNKLLVLLPLFILCSIAAQGAVYEGITFNKHEYAPGDVVDLHVEMDVAGLEMQIDASSLIDDFDTGMVAQRSEGNDYYFRFFLPLIDKDPDIYPVLINAKDRSENKSDAITVNFNLINYTTEESGTHSIRLLIEEKKAPEIPTGFVLMEVFKNDTIGICEGDNCTIMGKDEYQKKLDDATIVNDSYNDITALVTSQIESNQESTKLQVSTLSGSIDALNRQILILSGNLENAESGFRKWTIRQAIVFIVGILAMGTVFGAIIYTHHLKTKTTWTRP